MTRYIGNVEKVTHPDGSQEIKRYLPGDVLVTVYRDSHDQLLSEKTRYLHKDHLGSLDVITDALGNIATDGNNQPLVFSFDAWGQRRKAVDWTTYTLPQLLSFTPTIIDPLPTPRGFTMHEHLDAVGLIHMNGRVYDPRLGRFIQADPFVDGVTVTQGYNRYSYVHNNPLSATDPTGHFIFTLGAIALVSSGTVTGLGAIALTFGVAGFADALLQGASFGDALRTGIISGIAAAAFSSLNGVNFAESAVGEIIGGIAAEVLAYGAIGGIANVLQGGRFGHGFVSAGLSAPLGGGLAKALGGGPTAAFMSRVVVGGTISKATGGKFANGAVSAAFAMAVQAVATPATPLDSQGVKIGQCAETGKCNPDAFTPEEKAAIKKQVKALTTDITNKAFESMEDALAALHESGLVELTQEYGIEFWANIDVGTNEIYNVGTGFSNRFAFGSTNLRMNGDIIWHTHPSGKGVWVGDLRSAVKHGASWIFASGKSLSGYQNPNFRNLGNVTQFKFNQMSGMSFRTKIYNNGVWKSGRAQLQ